MLTINAPLCTHQFQFISVLSRAILQYNRADWSRSIVDKSADLENDVMMAQFVLLFLSRAIFRKEVKKFQYYCKKTNWHQFSMVYILLSTIAI